LSLDLSLAAGQQLIGIHSSITMSDIQKLIYHRGMALGLPLTWLSPFSKS